MLIDHLNDDGSSHSHSLSEKIYQTLRSDILAGRFKDGEELRENTLAKAYGVSRTPVREAIRQLALEGLVETIPNKGAFVNNIHLKDIKDVYAMRSRLEGLAARWAAENMSDKQNEALEEILYMSEYYRKKALWEQVYMCDNKFHEMFYEGCGSPMLEHVLKMFHEYVQQLRKTNLTDEKRAEESFKEHQAMVDAIKMRKPDEAEQLATCHIQNTLENWTRHHPDQTGNMREKSEK